ncbi:MAG: hypothetical protein ACSLEN_14625 [Candidatus Malihini olakiniferum]
MRSPRCPQTQEIGSVISTQGAISATAEQNITIEAGEATLDHNARSKWIDSGFLFKTTHTLHGETHERTVQSSTLSSDTVALKAGIRSPSAAVMYWVKKGCPSQ